MDNAGFGAVELDAELDADVPGSGDSLRITTFADLGILRTTTAWKKAGPGDLITFDEVAEVRVLGEAT